MGVSVRMRLATENALGTAAPSGLSTRPLVTHEQVARVMRARRGRWLLFIDIAVPRDVEPGVGSLDNVYLYDIDALSDVAAGNRAERERAAAQAESIIEAELRRSRERLATADVTPVIKALRKKAQGIAQAEVARVVPRLAGLSPRDRALVSGLADAVVNKLLHEPLTALKRSAAAAAADREDPVTRGAARSDERAESARSQLAQAVVALWSLTIEETPEEDGVASREAARTDTEESPS